MSTKLNDIADQALLGASLAPQTLTASANGSAIDMINADGPCFAVQQVGAVSGTSPTLAGKIQESADGSTSWSDITSATFTTVTASTNTQVVTFERTKRYLRYVATIGGTTPSFAAAALIGEQKKQI
jgi:hypothetical protein